MGLNDSEKLKTKSRMLDEVPRMNKKITINGEQRTVRAATLVDLLKTESINPSAKFVAVAINGSVIPRPSWSITKVKTGDSVEIVQPAPGG
mgnify:FL=1